MLLLTIHRLVLPCLDDETALVITADHGHIDGNDADSYNLTDMPEVVSLLRAEPAGEGRAMHLFIQVGQVERARELLSRLDGITILSKDELLDMRLLGAMPLRPGLEQHVGDLLLLPHDARRIVYGYQPRPHTTMMGRHGGLSIEEMIVPLLVYHGAPRSR